MPQGSDTHEVTDHLKIKHVRGDGKVAYDTEKDNKHPVLIFPSNPLKFCPACGNAPVPVVYYCPHCGNRYQQVLDTKSGRLMVILLPEEESAPADPSSNL